LRLPDASELKAALGAILKSLRKQRPFRIELGPDDLDDLVRSLSGLTLKQIRQLVAYVIFRDGKLCREDIQEILKRKSETLREQGILEFYPPEDNRYELGGFEQLQNWLSRARLGFSERAKAMNLTPPKGIMLVGVQGCGKSLAAKFVARNWNLPLLKLDAGRLYDKYIGESEKNFRKATIQAEAMAPNVLWIDEIEKGFSVAGSSDADGGLGYRLLGFMLTWLQEKKDGVFVVATANNIKALPPELLRKGRFDEIFFVDLPDFDERKQILQIHLKIRKQDSTQFDLDKLARATKGFSGAEIEQMIISALYRILRCQNRLSTEILLLEASATVPLSISRSEEITQLRSWAKERFVTVR
jgi:SpoVK/Ycf46/Vps4 family AAA+-type ATPase